MGDFTRLALIAGLALTAFAATPAFAEDDCPTLIGKTEESRAIPRGLLMAIAVTESGLNGQPDPLAMNIAGRGFRASSVTQMASIIADQARHGVRSIDVGCMQVNLKYHGMKFERPTDLLSSPVNVAYAGDFLVRLALESKSWRDAVMSYHNKVDPARRRWYGCKIWNTYLRLGSAHDGFLQCGHAPHGSSTASGTTHTATSPIILAGYNAPAAPSSPFGAAASTDMTPEMAGAVLRHLQPRAGPIGRIQIAAAGATIPDIETSDDTRANAFHAVKPLDWSNRLDPARQAEPTTTTSDAGGFGRVSGPSF